jgi:hypothetical protein
MIKNMVIIFLVCMVAILYYALFKVDAAIQPIDPVLTPEVTDGPYQHRPPVVLVNYAHGPEVFFKNQNALVQSAAGKGFNIMMNYNKGHIAPIFYNKNKDILDQKRGAGYWLWKPYFILKTLKMMPENAVIIYADSGVVFSKPITAFLKEVEKKPILFIHSDKIFPLRAHLKKEAWPLLGLGEKDPRLDEKNLWAFFMVIKNTPETRAFMEEWLSLCQIKEAITDTPFDASKQDPIFKSHLHDQSILDVVAATRPENLMFITKRELENTYGVVNFHRHPQKQFRSPLFRSAGIPQTLSRIFFNNILIQYVRQYLY